MSRASDESARAVIEQLWYRARINAFAHRAAAEEATTFARKSFQRELVAALGAILAVIIVYVLATSQTTEKVAASPSKGAVATLDATSRQAADNPGQVVSNAPSSLPLIFTLISITLTLYSLYESVMANYSKLNVKAARHEHLLNSYQFIAQRAREVKWPGLPADEVVALLKDLERDFSFLKATGTEPSDRHFDIAQSIVRKIRGDRDSRIAQSFDVGAVEEYAQHLGDPSKIPGT
jgi:hypothetical protein